MGTDEVRFVRALWLVIILSGCASEVNSTRGASSDAFEDGDEESVGCQAPTPWCDARLNATKAQFENDNRWHDHLFVCVEPGTDRLVVRPRELALRSAAFYEINAAQSSVRGRRVQPSELESYQKKGVATRRFAEIRIVNVGDTEVVVEPHALGDAQQDVVVFTYDAAYAAVDSGLVQVDTTMGEIPSVELSPRSKVLYSVVEDNVEHAPEMQLTLRPAGASRDAEVVAHVYALR
jgi:hypothetical protein